MEDKVFKYLQTTEKTLDIKYGKEKQKLDKATKEYRWDSVIIHATNLSNLKNQLNLISSMIEAHESGDI